MSLDNKRFNGLVDEILFYSERSYDGRWIIPIEVDWDYTLTKCSSWESGEMILNDLGFEVMKKWQEKYNVGWILNSMRNDELLKEPMQILKERGINVYGVRKNPLQAKDENEVTKSFAIMCVDDRNINSPIRWHEDCERPYVDWDEIDKCATPILDYIYEKLSKAKL